MRPRCVFAFSSGVYEDQDGQLLKHPRFDARQRFVPMERVEVTIASFQDPNTVKPVWLDGAIIRRPHKAIFCKLPALRQRPYLTTDNEVCVGMNPHEVRWYYDFLHDDWGKRMTVEELRKAPLHYRRAEAMYLTLQVSDDELMASAGSFLPRLYIELKAKEVEAARYAYMETDRFKELARAAVSLTQVRNPNGAKPYVFRVRSLYEGVYKGREHCINQPHKDILRIGDDEQEVPVTTVLFDKIKEGTPISYGQPIADVCQRHPYPKWEDVEAELETNTPFVQLSMAADLFDPTVIPELEHGIVGYGSLCPVDMVPPELIPQDPRYVFDFRPLLHCNEQPVIGALSDRKSSSKNGCLFEKDGYYITPAFNMPADNSLVAGGVTYYLSPPVTSPPKANDRPFERRPRGKSITAMAHALRAANVV